MNPDDLMRELLQTFQVEASEHLQTLNLALLSLEVRPEEVKRKELIQEAFRAAHSLKGAARAVGLDPIEMLSHGMESVLQRARDTGEHLDASVYDVLYDVLDSIGSLLEGNTVEIDPILKRLEVATHSDLSADADDAAAELPPPVAAAPVAVAPVEEPVAQKPVEVAPPPPPPAPVPVPVAVVAPPAPVAPPPAPVAPAAPPTPAPEAPHAANGASKPASRNGSSSEGSRSSGGAKSGGESGEESTAMPIATSSEETIRVAIAKLDNLMAQVGELLVSRMNAEQRVTEMHSIRQQFTEWPKAWREIKTLLPKIDSDSGKRLTELLLRYQEQYQASTQDVSRYDERLRADTLRLGTIASQLQDSVRDVRMVPFETLVPVLQRAVRDAAHLEGKQVSFNVNGSEVELDKKVLEMLKDPFMHMLRNAVSHGIEKPDVRKANGKSPEGKVTLSLQQRGSEVRISVADDGAGFDLNRLRKAGADKADQRLDERASDDDVIELAFLPGVTTNKEVTALSGRGIGLDVVRQRLEALQGRIEVDSTPGQGSTIHLLVPSTLTISRGLLVQVGDERYVLPLLSIEKILEPKQTFTIEGHMMVTVDGQTLPLVSMASLLERPSSPQTGETGLAVIMAVAEQRLALLVDDVLTEQELAVKPLGKPLHRVRNVSGASLMGDGRPVVILNAADLIRAAKGARAPAVVQKQQAEEERTSVRILVVDDSITTRTLEKNILETAGYEVTTATDGMEALRRLKEDSFDLVVSDVQMPNMDGIGLVRSLRESSEFGDLPLILVTSLESHEDRERGMVAGANAYIVKRGFDQAELLKTVQRLVVVEEG